jgi:hypothetical protein
MILCTVGEFPKAVGRPQLAVLTTLLFDQVGFIPYPNPRRFGEASRRSGGLQ